MKTRYKSKVRTTKLPAVIDDTLKSYATHFYEQDQGYGSGPAKAKKAYERDLAKLQKWWLSIQRRLLAKKQVTTHFVNSSDRTLP